MAETQILVTGGAGFIGRHFIDRLLSDTDWTIVNLDLLTYAGHRANIKDLDHPRHEFIQGDIADSNLVGGILTKYEPQYVVNLAAESHVDHSISSPLDFAHTNVLGTCRLLETIRRHRDQSQALLRFVQVSTDEVYGTLGAQGQFDEDSRYAPRSPYAASKAAADHFVRAYYETYGLPIVVTNSSNNYGSFQFPEKLVPVAILNALENKTIPIYGDGNQVRDWLHVSDHTDALLRILEKGRVGETYHIGGNNERTNLALVTDICAMVDAALAPRTASHRLIRHVADRLGHDRRYALDTEKIQTELGWSPTMDIEEGLRSTVNWYLQNLDWVEHVRAQDVNGHR